MNDRPADDREDAKPPPGRRQQAVSASEKRPKKQIPLPAPTNSLSATFSPRGDAQDHGSDDLFRQLVEGVEDYAIIVLDPQGNIASWNEGARRITGYQSDEIIGHHFSCFYSSEDIAANKPQADLAIAKATGRYAEEKTRRRKDGSLFWGAVAITPLYDPQQQLRGFAKVTRDITSSKDAQATSGLMVNLALNAMVLVNQQGTIVLVNPQTETLFGYTSAQLVGQLVETLVPDRFKAEHPTNRSRYFRNSVVRPMGAGRDLHGRRSDGSEFPVEIGLHPIEADGSVQVLVSIVDITERKRAEEQARKYLTELAHVARLSTTGQMVSELAHEMNQPLAAAANYARACVSFARSEKGATVEQLAGWMEKAAAQIDRTLGIVNRLAGFVKNEPANRARININRVIENIVALAVPGGGISPSLVLDEALPPVLADRIQIEQVLLNLVRNGVEAMQDADANKPSLVIRTCAENEFVRVDVTDKGKGIPPEDLSKLFSPFFTTKPNGMGLGLSISRSIVENHRGEMLVTSIVGKGTTFSFTLPVPKVHDAL